MKKLSQYALFLLLSAQSLSVSAQAFSVFGNYLYWKPSEQSTSAWVNVIGFPVNNNHTLTYGVPAISFDRSSGFRGGIAYESPSRWNAKLYWTHLPTSQTASYVAGNGQILTPEYFSGFLSSDAFTSANINWKIAMNTIDLELSRDIEVAKTFSFSPVIGIKGARINQAINSAWHATLFTIPVFTATENVTNNYSGIGPSLGVDGQWNFYQGFSLVGNFSTAFMWGKWNINDTYARPSSFGGLHPAATYTTSMNNAKLGTAVFQYFVGLEWAYHAKYDVNFLLGYEMQYWPSQLRAPTFQLLPLHGDLTLQGATCGISIGL